MALPGLYMDAVNPDYIAARIINPDIHNPVFLIPTALMPILGNLYHGMQNFYIGIPFFAIFGFNMLALRLAQGLFGAVILWLLHLILMRVTGSKWIALAGSLGLATELAFIASFRTQMYIVISGSFWLLCAVYLALMPRQVGPKGGVGAVDTETFVSHEGVRGLAKSWILSGICAGLSVYGYFVFIFFVPVFLIMGWEHTRSWRLLWGWCLGFVLGMQTYVLGYVSLAIKEKGLASTLGWINAAVQGLSPMSSTYNILQRLENAWMLTRLALQDAGNELMIFGTASPNRWASWKVELFVMALLSLLVVHLWNSSGARLRLEPDKKSLLAYWHIAWLPISFISFSLLFGNRLWVHHFTPFIPLMYLLLALFIHFLRQLSIFSLPSICWLAIALIFVFGNMQQQSVFFKRLKETGGNGKYSNAINRMAEDALSLPDSLVHVFPEWGLMMPFAFLTANQRAYEIDISSENLQRLAQKDKILRLYYWKREDVNLYTERLLVAGFEVRDSGEYMQRDQRTAFAWIEAALKKPIN
jgi:hypothetical protein